MKPLNRPMFRMGGPIKEGIMDGIEEPRVGFRDGTPPGFFGFTFDKPLSLDMLKGPRLLEKQLEKNISIAGQPDFSMTDLYKTPIIKGDLFASTSPVIPQNKNIEMVDQETITTADIDPFENIEVRPSASGTGEFDTADALGIVDETKTETVPSKSKIMIPDRNRGKILSDPDKTPKDPKADSELLQKLGYDRAVRKGNYALIEAIRRGLTEGGVQGALDAAFAAGATDPYSEASKIRQAAELKEFERKADLEDYEKKLKLKSKFDKTTSGKGIIQKNYEFLTGVLKMDPDKATRIATKSHATIDEAIFDVQKGSGLPAINTNVLDSAGGLFYGNEYKGKADPSAKLADSPDGWYLVGGNQFVEVKDGKKVDESRTYEVAQR
tara:strand:+ start:1002 stop:2147 length:1146 start_codon:yes stop_codon:yes gene_type:complete